MEQLSAAALMRSCPSGVVITDVALSVIECVGEAERTFGWTRDELLGRPFGGGADCRFPDGDAAPFHERLAAGEVAHAHLQVRCKDDSWCELDVVARPLRAASGVLLGWLWMTEHSQDGPPSDALRAEHDTLTHVVDGANDATWDWRVPSGEVLVNGRWLEMLGRTDGPLNSHISTWANLVHPDDVPQVRQTMQAHLAGHTPAYQAEYRLRHGDGHWVWVLDRGKVVERADDGAALRVSGAFTDITDRKQTEQHLQAALAENETLVRELREALQRVHTLAGLVPICMHCKKVRDDAGYWARIEEYLASHTGAAVTHGICPQCLREHYPGYAE